MNKVILTAPNGKTTIFKTKGDYNIPFNALAPSIKQPDKFFSQKDLTFIEDNLIKMGMTAKDALQFIAKGKTIPIIYSVPIDGRKTPNKSLPYFAWDIAYQFVKDNID